ncbi:MAG TPA: aromatic ring-hydroxylating dioxygenase subunit alpha [Caulobacteraceae bacterium]|nr:aromatic ring-hydroxylating dioxygenase subunit alpha [Caulobacteraceae bacterium]
MNDVWSENPLKLAGSRVINRNIYVDPAIYAAEQEKLFARTWQWVGHESEIREFGDYITATIAGRPIVIARGEEGRISAFLNTCTHRGALLTAHARGNNAGSFVCMYHGWCFDTEGRLTSAPISAAYGENLRKACYDSPTVRHEVFAGNIFVSLDPNIEPLVDFLGESGPYIERFTGRHEALGRVRWALKGNWKLWHENFRDNYHPMFTHAVIGANYQGVKIEGVNRDLAQGHSLLAFPTQGNQDHIRTTIRRITGRSLDANVGVRPAGSGGVLNHHIMAVFPNLDFQNSGDGRIQNVLQVVRPVAIDKAVVELVAFGEVGEPAEARQARLDRSLDGQTSAGKISGDDTEAVRRCSAGFGAVREVGWSNMDRGQVPGPEGGKNDEYSLRAFYDAYKRRMGDSLLVAG